PDALARFEEVLAAAQAAGPLTEEHNYWLDRRNMTNVAGAARAFGARLVRDGALRDGDEVFLLYVAEVRQALRKPMDLSALIAERIEEQLRWRTFEAPETIGTADPVQHSAATATIGMRHLLYRAAQDDPTRVLHGAAASAGVARPRAQALGLADGLLGDRRRAAHTFARQREARDGGRERGAGEDAEQHAELARGRRARERDRDRDRSEHPAEVPARGEDARRQRGVTPFDGLDRGEPHRGKRERESDTGEPERCDEELERKSCGGDRERDQA